LYGDFFVKRFFIRTVIFFAFLSSLLQVSFSVRSKAVSPSRPAGST